MPRSFLQTSLLACILFVVLAVFCQSTIAQEETSETSTKLIVYHEKDGDYIKRGEIVGLPGTPEYVPANNEVVNFKSEKDVFYQIKVKDEQSGKIILSSVKMCQMVASEWKDEFILHLNENNEFYYLSYYAGSNECPQNLKYPITTKPFTTTISVVQGVPAPRPLLGNFGSQKAKASNTKKATAKVNDEVPDAKEEEEKTFFQKYWYLLLGGAFMIMSLGSAPEPPAAPAARR